MRFRATVENAMMFHKIVQAVEKLQKKLVIKFTETDMHIICASDINEGGVQVWSQIRIPSLFSDYRIQSNAGNQITVTLSSEALASALRSASAQSSSNSSGSLSEVEVLMRLAKKNDQAVLSFEMNGTSRSGARVHVTHDVRIEVMKPQDVEHLAEPLCPEPDVHILLPPLSKLRTVVERLKAHTDIIGVRANRRGRLMFSLRTDSVKTNVTWEGLNNPTMVRPPGAPPAAPPELSQASQASQPNNISDAEKERMVSVLVSVKSLLRFLNSHVIATTTIACLCQNHCIILYVYIGEVADAGGVLTFYLPAVVEDAP